MDINTELITKPSHGFALLKELDSQRRTGTFCDCVIRLHVHPDQLFLAHKSVLAAFSPVFATLLPQHGSFMELNSPLLTPETLALLLDYMYTGTLPPKSHEEPVMYAAFHLQMEQLYHALIRQRREKDITQTGQDQANRKRGYAEDKSLDKTLLSPSFLPPSAPSYEVVPVICHLKTAGPSKPPLQSRDKTLNAEHSRHVSEANKHPQSSLESFLESSQSKLDKTEPSVNDTPSVVAEDVEKFNSCCKTGHFQSRGSQNVTAGCSNTDNKDQCVHSASTSRQPLYPEPDCRKSGSRCVSDVDGIQPFHVFESEKQAPGILSDNNSESTYHAFSQHMAESFLENSSSSDTNDTVCEKRPLDLNTWQKVRQCYAPTSKVTLGEEAQRTSPSDCCEFTNLKKDCVNVYQGHFTRYHLVPESNDSNDSDGTYPGPVERKDHSEALETIDMAEILLSTRGQLKSGSHNNSKTRRFQCSVPECEKAFSQRGSLNRHMRSHLGIRPYSCPLCTMTFSRQYRVTEHMRVHQRSCDDPP